MYKFDEEDLRRPVEVPRVSPRLRARLGATWYPPQRRLGWGKPSPVQIEVLDLSIGGALLHAPTNKRLEVGLKIKMDLRGASGVVDVRNMRPSSTPGRSYYGVSFYNLNRNLEMTIMGLLADHRTDPGRLLR